MHHPRIPRKFTMSNTVIFIFFFGVCIIIVKCLFMWNDHRLSLISFPTAPTLIWLPFLFNSNDNVLQYNIWIQLYIRLDASSCSTVLGLLLYGVNQSKSETELKIE